MKKPANIQIKIPKYRNPVAATLRDPSNGFTQKVIPEKNHGQVLDRKRKHKGRPFDDG